MVNGCNVLAEQGLLTEHIGLNDAMLELSMTLTCSASRLDQNAPIRHLPLSRPLCGISVMICTPKPSSQGQATTR